MHTSTNQFIQMNSDAFIQMHLYELSNYTYANADVLTSFIYDIFHSY